MGSFPEETGFGSTAVSPLEDGVGALELEGLPWAAFEALLPLMLTGSTVIEDVAEGTAEQEAAEEEDVPEDEAVVVVVGGDEEEACAASK